MNGAGDAFDAEAFLNSLEPIGWKLGLERMEMLSDELGRPQDSYSTIHVVGTNGKSSVSRMIAAICEAHGFRAGCSLSPHLAHWSERVVISGEEEPALFADCVRRTSEAAATVNTRLEDEEVTQFELATAAAFLALAESGVQVAAIEAGLGGRLDATNSIDSLATVLTSIGLDHTEYLGETEVEIAGEKLAVLRPGTTLVLGPVSAEVLELARTTAEERGCELLEITGAAAAGAAGSNAATDWDQSASSEPTSRSRKRRRHVSSVRFHATRPRRRSHRWSSTGDSSRSAATRSSWPTSPTTRPVPGPWLRPCPRWPAICR